MSGLWTEAPLNKTSFQTLLADHEHACAYATERKEKWGDGDSEHLAAKKKGEDAAEAIIGMYNSLIIERDQLKVRLEAADRELSRLSNELAGLGTGHDATDDPLYKRDD